MYLKVIQVVQYFLFSATHRCLRVYRKCLASSSLLIAFHCFSSKNPPLRLHHATPEHQVEQCCADPICLLSNHETSFVVLDLIFVDTGIVLDSLANNLVEDVSEEWMAWRLAGVNLKRVCIDVDSQVMLTHFNGAVLSDTLTRLRMSAKFTLPNVLIRLQNSVFFEQKLKLVFF